MTTNGGQARVWDGLKQGDQKPVRLLFVTVHLLRLEWHKKPTFTIDELSVDSHRLHNDVNFIFMLVDVDAVDLGRRTMWGPPDVYC